ncbi:methionyl-tRNA formyltransferase [Kribbella sp. NPDC056345]|uniref:methionyl-tRNA formyltransferase n=1 Tax=Kribbella sp. NPDC056345 TaxID=3345789 RepID=UPI0035DC83F6
MRIVALSSYLPSYRLISDWAARAGHEVVLVVTLPPTDRYGSGPSPFAEVVSAETGVLMTSKLKSTAAAMIGAMQPDLVVSAAFPRLIPDEILRIPAYGALNLHPSRLPNGRGPNPVRVIYEGATTVDVTIHRTDNAFDTGAIMAQRSAPLPTDLTGPALFAAWIELLGDALDEAGAKAFARDPGVVQQDDTASYAAMFEPAEFELDFREPSATIIRKAAALNIMAPRAVAVIQGERVVVSTVRVAEGNGTGAPGAVLAKDPEGWDIRSGDGVVRVTG